MRFFEVFVSTCLLMVTLCCVAMTASYLERQSIRECRCPAGEVVIQDGAPEGTQFGWLPRKVGQ